MQAARDCCCQCCHIHGQLLLLVLEGSVLLLLLPAAAVVFAAAAVIAGLTGGDISTIDRAAATAVATGLSPDAAMPLLLNDAATAAAEVSLDMVLMIINTTMDGVMVVMLVGLTVGCSSSSSSSTTTCSPGPPTQSHKSHPDGPTAGEAVSGSW